MSKGTARRTIRIAEDLWSKASDMAEEREDSVSNIIRKSLDSYVAVPIKGDPMSTMNDHAIVEAAFATRSDEELAYLITEWSEWRGDYILILATDVLTARNKKARKALMRVTDAHVGQSTAAATHAAFSEKLKELFDI